MSNVIISHKEDEQGNVHIIYELKEKGRSMLQYAKFMREYAQTYTSNPPSTLYMECKNCGFSSKYVGDWFEHECEESETNE